MDLWSKIKGIRPLWWFLAFFVAMNLLWLGPSLMGGRTIEEGTPAPDFSLPVLGEPGVEFSLRSARGSTVLLAFWATWCDACVEELPLIEQAARSWSDRGLKVVGMNVEPENRRMVELFVRERSPGYTNVVVDRPTWDSYKIRTLPAIVLVDPDGNVCKAMIGRVGKAKLGRSIEACLAPGGRDQ